MKNYDESGLWMRIISHQGRSLTMIVDSDVASEAMPKEHERLGQSPKPQSAAKMKARQTAKIQEIARALHLAGFQTLDAQAKILGVGRSTAWTILKSNHKGSGLSARTIGRLLSVRQLPLIVRTTILEYVEEKAAGRYGHNARTRRKFIIAITRQRVEAVKKANTADRRLPNQASLGPSAADQDIERRQGALRPRRTV
jgi:hypothetical protein